MKTAQEIFWNYINSGEGRFFYKDDLSVPFINGFSLILLSLLVPFGVLRIFLGGYQAGVILLTTAFLLFINVLYLRMTLRPKQAAGIIALLTTALGGYTFWEGSIFGTTGIFWIYPIPVLVFFLSGKVKGIFWSSILLLVLCTLTILSTVGIIHLPYNTLDLQEAFVPLIAVIAGLYMYADFIERNRKTISEQRVRDEILLENIGEGVIAIDTEGTITKANTTARIMLGWDKDDLIGTNITKSIPCLDQDGNALSDKKRPFFIAMRKKISCPIEGYLVTKNGDKIPVSGIANPILVDNKTVAMVETFRDVTKEREIEKMRLDLLSLASHQLRTPLSGTKWLIETLKKGIHGNLNKQQTEYIDEIYKINERMTGLVSDMLSTLRIESGFESFKTEAVSSAQLFNELKVLSSSAAQARTITLNFTMSEPDVQIITAPDLLRNILENLLSNAIKYSHNNSEVIITCSPQSNTVIFSVQDFGIGIPKKEQGGLFSRFYRASNARTFNTTSSGLGLYIAATLAQKIGAKISFESTENKGSTFRLTIPRVHHKAHQPIALK